jgi:hypothetical protein
MDCREMFYDPINPLPRKCSKCGFPDLDHVPQPYLLVKSRTMSPNELALAENGNFFVCQRVRRVLEALAPGQCTYYPTFFRGTSQETPWLLAVPKHQVVTAKVKASIPRCEACGEPRSAHPGTQWQPLAKGWTGESEHDVLKSSTWGSSEKGWNQWISRDLFISVRLLHLLKKIKAKGFHEATCGTPTPPDKDESAWIKEKLRVVEASGIPLHADGTLSDEDARWFRDYIKGHSRKVGSMFDIQGVEKRLKFKLPKSYIEFVTKVGPVSFENIDEQEGFTASLLAPDELDAEAYRAGKLDADEETNAVDGVMFARTGHGDCFSFRLQKGTKEYPVFLFKHEYNCFEPYAENFAACVKRFAGGGDD